MWTSSNSNTPTRFFDLDITEQTVIAIIDKLHQSSTNTSITLLDLKNVLINLSIESKGYQLSIDDIRRYFRTGSFPIIIHETYPKNHYALCIGIIDDYAILADPSIGKPWFSIKDMTIKL
jgi:predicted double-glycine peptidase